MAPETIIALERVSKRFGSTRAVRDVTFDVPRGRCLGWSVELDKGEFQGRAALAKAKAETQLRLTSVVLESGGDEASGAPLWVDGEEVGIVTQAVVSPFLGGKTLGLAKIRKDLREEGQGVVAQVGDEQVAGEVAQHPVYDKERRRAKES